MILTQGGRFGGWCLYMKDGKPVYTYNYLGLERFTVASPSAVPQGAATVVLDFAYEGKNRRTTLAKAARSPFPSMERPSPKAESRRRSP